MASWVIVWVRSRPSTLRALRRFRLLIGSGAFVSAASAQSLHGRFKGLFGGGEVGGAASG